MILEGQVITSTARVRNLLLLVPSRRLYGLTRKQLRYILDPWEEVSDPLDPQGYAERQAKSSFPGETFRVPKEKEIREHGEYRTRRLILQAWKELQEDGIARDRG